MKMNARSSITLPRQELALVERLKRRTGDKSNVAVVRRALRLLQETTERERLREAFRTASLATRVSTEAELRELDHLTAEGLDE
jgi:Arc/MetJ-type ribon-helix-helix transcriptional regulator